MKNSKKSPKSNDHMFLTQSEENIKHMLDKWRSENLPHRVHLVHTIPASSRFDGPLFRQRAEDVLNTWDVISTSLIDLNKIPKVPPNGVRSSFTRDTQMFYEIAFVLYVPCQNIIGTFSKDVYFPNHAGRENASPVGKVINSAALFEHISSGERKLKSNGDRLPRVEGGYNQITSPTEILCSTTQRTHNEILIIGKSGVNIYKGLPQTQKVKVIGIMICPRNIPSYHLDNDEHNKKWIKLQDTLMSLNPGVPCEFV
ncbi:Uncharacterised protein [Buttiauxella agrestis]|uniref:Uncharacterized protein n=1 Tax=Buttiauxella agrestis TaxID=82977 RepID=A0A381KNG0_9ENTR|nr:hypothetical protein [Buttiauxella agrestis]SUY92914.1 Uncharacterised protein [Buttiauxella agrestis]